jgi:hypothetical protein
MKNQTKNIFIVGLLFIVAIVCIKYFYSSTVTNGKLNQDLKSKIESRKLTYNKSAEFGTFSNGLIYSEATMNKLGQIVDSLNLKFKKCNLSNDFDSKYQTIGCIVFLEKRKVKQAKRDMENQISLEDFIKKYSKAIIKREVLIVKSYYLNQDKKESVSIDYADLHDDNYSFNIASEEQTINGKDIQNKWIFRYNEKTEYSDERIKAFYFTNQFTSKKLPLKYAQMIGYSDCLIEPNAAIYKKELKDSLESLPKNWMILSQKDKLVLLDRLRSTRVFAFCGMDSRPREQEMRIALVAAETASWEVFLLAH